MQNKRIGLFIIPIKINNQISTYNDYVHFAKEAEVNGYTDIYIGEHLTDPIENIQSSIVFSASVLAKTEKIRVNLAVLPLPHYDIKLLIKQLEDLYLLGKGRLAIGFSQGALDTDLEYLGIEPKNRGKIFRQKLKEFQAGILESNVLAEQGQLPEMFSTLLSDFPIKAGYLAEAGYSALSSNFCNPNYLDSHVRCISSGLGKSPKRKSINEVKWYVGVNLVPENAKESTVEIIKESLFYIYAKLRKCNKEYIMTGASIDNHLEEPRIKSQLFEELCSSKVKESIERVTENQGIFSHYVINLFDCFDDKSYKQYILDYPERLNESN